MSATSVTAAAVRRARESRDSEALEALLATLSHRPRFPRGLVLELTRALKDDDLVVVEWATVALGQVRKPADCKVAKAALKRVVKDDEARESSRACAAIALGRLGWSPSAGLLKKRLKRDHASPHGALFLLALLDSTQVNGTGPQIVRTLKRARTRVLDEGTLKAVRIGVDAALQECTIRVAAQQHASGRVSDLLGKAGQDVALRLQQRRIQNRIDTLRAGYAQSSLFVGTSQAASPDVRPGVPLAHAEEEMYARSLAAWADAKIRKRRVYARDFALAQERKRRQNWTCQVCGRKQDGRIDAHHVEPRHLGGDDTGENILVVCSNCHRETEGGQLQCHLVETDQGSRIQVSFAETQEVYLLSTAGKPDDQDALRIAGGRRELLRLFRALPAHARGEVLAQLTHIVSQNDRG